MQKDMQRRDTGRHGKQRPALPSGSRALTSVRIHIPPSVPHDAPMPLTLRPYHRFPVQCAVTYNASIFQRQGIVANVSCSGWRLSDDLPTRPGKIPSLTLTLPNEQRIEIPEAVVLWSRGQEFAIENPSLKPDIRARLQHYVNRLIQEPAERVL